MFLVHPTLTEAEIERTCESILADGEKGDGEKPPDIRNI
jgi:hypothetical protein